MAKRFATLFGIAFFSFVTFAAEEAKQEMSDSTQNSKEVTIQSVVDEYKTYAATVSPAVRNEVIAYRKEIANLNKQKRELYQKLTQESQNYLAKEQEFKRKLPLKKKKLVSLESQKDQEEDNKEVK